MIKRIAVIAGGFSGEYEISLLSAKGIMAEFPEDYEVYLVLIDKDKWIVKLSDKSEKPCSRDPFGFSLDEQTWITFDYAYITIHGTPGEDGPLQGYLDLMNVPYNTGGILVEALTFNKFVCNKYLSTLEGVRIAPAMRFTRKDSLPSNASIIESLGLPLFVKPNVGGSSVATTKVKSQDQLSEAICEALAEGEEVIIEAFIDGLELTSGAFFDGNEIVALPITEVVTKNEFFDFRAKYKGEVEEITPARISDELTKSIQALTKKIYSYIKARGVIRVDYIVEKDGKPTLLEVNTTPGMTPTSFIPQQVRASGRTMKDFIKTIIRTTS